MKFGKKLFLMACVGVCALCLAACGKEGEFSAGTEMNGDELRDYREKLLAEAAEKETEATESPEENMDEEQVVCYYTEKGGKWHTRANCQYLKNSKEILEGGLEAAAAAGKTEPCSACAAAYK